MRIRKTKQPFRITLEYRNEVTKTVTVKAADRETAERRALKFNSGAIRVVR